MSGRLVVIGIDGASYDMVAKLAADGTLPVLRQLSQEATLWPMVSSLPEVSPVAWSSIMTGADPGEHGVYGFTDLAPGSYRTTFASSHSRAVQPFWERKANGRAVVINMPFTYPARPMNGALIAGFVALDLEKATHPPSLVPELRRLGYRMDADSGRAHQSLELFVKDLNRTLEARIAVYRYLWEAEPWQTFVLVFTGTDRLSHFLWDAYEDPSHPYHEAFIDHFRQVDAAVGEIIDRLRPKDTLAIVSDHGFERLEQNVYLNAALRQAGLLCFETENPKSLRDIAAGARAFALEPSRIYLHTTRYPKGAVAESERESVLRDIVSLCQGLTWMGKPAIQKVYRKEEIYRGPLVGRAPDLVLLAEPRFNLRGNLQAKEVFNTDVFAGKHARDNAILLIHGDHADRVQPSGTVHPHSDCTSGRVHVSDVLGLLDQVVGHGSGDRPATSNESARYEAKLK